MTSEEHASIICLALPFGRVYPNVGADAFEPLDWAHLAGLFRLSLDVVSGPFAVRHSAVYVAGAQEGQGEG